MRPGRPCCCPGWSCLAWEPRAHPALLAAASPLSRQVFGPAVASLPGPELPASGLDGPQGGEVNATGGASAESLGLGGPRYPSGFSKTMLLGGERAVEKLRNRSSTVFLKKAHLCPHSHWGAWARVRAAGAPQRGPLRASGSMRSGHPRPGARRASLGRVISCKSCL